MERNLKFKVGDKVKVIATEEQLKDIGILLEFCNDDFYYIEKISPKRIGFSIYTIYTLSNGYNLQEYYLNYAD